MRVRLLSLVAGPGGVWLPGNVVDVEPPVAQAWIAGGYAEAVDAPRVPANPPAQETAALAVPETPEQRKRPPAKRKA